MLNVSVFLSSLNTLSVSFLPFNPFIPLPLSLRLSWGWGFHLNCSLPPPFPSLGCICPVYCLVRSLLISVLFLLLSAFSLWSLHLSHSLQHSFLPALSFCPLPHSAPLPVSLFHSQILMMWFQRPRGWTAAYRRPVPNSQPRAGDSAPLGPAWETVSAQQKVMISRTRRLVPRCYLLILHYWCSQLWYFVHFTLTMWLVWLQLSVLN